MLVDSHCHLDRVSLAPYANNFDLMMTKTQEAGVQHMLCPGISLKDYTHMHELVSDYPQVSVSVGVHPQEPESITPVTVEQLVKLAQDPKVVAIGEVGLDYYRAPDNIDAQKQRFRTHIRAAHICQKPLIIHTRQADTDTLHILREEQASEVGGVLHCFTGDWDMAKAALDMGFYISFSGIVTFPKAGDLRLIASKIPLEFILIETDSPYLAPVPYRGKSNEPKYVSAIADQIAACRNISADSLISATGTNFFRLFKPAITLN
ncbi:deoxyribonuclease [Achromatium sp. WMS2]|nr:deoxyribonuclease [Achromatium sp. WMS2]